MSSAKARRVLPGFGLSIGVTLSYLSLIVLMPLAAVFIKSAALGWTEFWHVATTPRVVASYRLSFGASLLAAAINVVFGLMLAWSLVRYNFPGQEARRCADRSSVRAADGGRRHCAHRALCPERLARPVSRAARHQGRLHAARRARRSRLHRPAVRRAHRAADSRGSRRRARGGGSQPRRHALADDSVASCCRRCCRRLLTGFALAFARAVGEYGSVIFIAGNIPMVSEITPLIIITKLEQYDYAGATAVAAVMLVVSFILLLSSTGCRRGPRAPARGRLMAVMHAIARCAVQPRDALRGERRHARSPLGQVARSSRSR